MANIKVGTVYIDVEPDVSKFSEKLRTKLLAMNLGKTVEQTMAKATKSVSKFGKDSDKLSVSLDRVGDRTSNFNNKMLLLRNSLSLIKIPAIFAGLGLVAQALLAVAAGVVAVVAALGPLSGLITTVPAGLLAIAAAAVTVKLAFKGVSEELKLLSKNAEEAVAPAVKEFALFLYTLKPLKTELQNIASSSLLPDIERGMITAFSPGNISAAKSIISDTAQSLGGLFIMLGEEFRNPAWAQAFLTISETSTRGFDKIGGALIGATAGFRDLLIAGQPLLRWLQDITTKGLELLGAWAGNAAASGRAAKFFQETADITHLLGSILGRLSSALVNIGKAAYPLGKLILVSLNEQLGKLSEWAKSAGGQQSLRAYFENSLPVLRSAALLVGALAKTFFGMGQAIEGSGLANFMDRIRTEVLPIFESAVTGSEGLGQALLDLSIAAAKVLSIFLSTTGPLTAFAKAVAQVANAFADLLANNPLLAEFATTLAAVLALSKAFALTKAVTYIFYMTKALLAQGVAATIAGRAQWSLNVAMRANPIGLIVTAIQLLAVGLFLLWKRSETFRGAVKALFSFLRDVGVVILKVLTFQFKLFLRAIEAVASVASHLPERLGGEKFQAVADAAHTARTALDGAIESLENVGKASTDTGNKVSDMASKSSGAIVKLDTVLKGRLKSTTATLTKVSESLADSFSDLSSKALKAFDADTTRLLDNLVVKVQTYGESWTLKAGDLTPAERELKALDEIEAKRSRTLKRQQLNKDLKEAKGRPDVQTEVNGKIITIQQGPDKERIKEINEEIRQLNVDDRRRVLEARAVVERKAADKALETGRRNLQSQRDVQREHFEKELTALQAAIAKGKLTQERFRRETAALLAKYGVDLKAAGQLLGNAFAGSLNRSMLSVQEQARKTNAALTRILELRKEIAAYNALHKDDTKFKTAGYFGITQLGNNTPPALEVKGDQIIGQMVQTQIVTDESVAREIGAAAARRVTRR